MKSTNSTLSLIALSVFTTCCSRSLDEITENDKNDVKFEASYPPLSKELQSKLDLSVTLWDDLIHSNINEGTLLESQKNLAFEVIRKLGPTPELKVFLDYILERGAGDVRDEVLREGLRGMFAGDEASAASEWALRYAKDRPTREALMHLAGEEFRGPGFVAFFERVAVEGCHNSQASLLAGYCTTLARTNPEAALKTYRDLGYPFRIDNTGMMSPAYLVAQGAIDAEEADRLRLPGYDAEAWLMTGEWPAGGPLPRVLGYQPGRHGTGAGPGDALHLKRTATDKGITAVWHDESMTPSTT